MEKFPSHRLFKIDPVKTQINTKLLMSFKVFVQSQHLLEKVFLSVKGIYFQARINGYPVIWLEPYPFSQTLPFDVDYKVMLSFLEFNQVYLKFVLFKLYKNSNMVFPPQFHEISDRSLNPEESVLKNVEIKSTGEQDEMEII